MHGGASWQRVLVTGASGFLGRHLVAGLTHSNVEVTGVSRSTGFDVERDDLKLDSIDHVFHLAALTGVPASWEDPVAFHRVNANGTVRVLEACRRAGGVPVTHVSAYVYGRPASLPIAESAEVQANNPYAFSKYAAEQGCRFYAEHCGGEIAVIRPFNIYGPGQDERFLVPYVVRQVLDPACAAIELQDLAPRRDYVHVADVVAAILAIARARASGTYNVGSGISYSVAELVDFVQRAAGSAKPVHSAELRRRNEIDDVRADIGAIAAAVGWRPAISLERGLRDMVEELRQR